MPTIHVEKSAQIQAPLQQVYDHLRDFKQWPEWSPWLITDPDCHLTYADDGSAYSWEGKVCGAGEMTVVGETSPHRIDSKLTFFKPWKSHADVRLQLSERNGTTTVIWSMDSTLPFFLFWMKAMMIAFIGMDYQRGLAMLKDKLETGSVPSHLEFLGQRSQPGFAFVGKRTSCPITEMSVKMEADFDQLRKWLEKEGLTPTNHFLSVYHRWDIVKGVVDYTAAAPIAAVPDDLPPDLVTGHIPPCQTFSIRHEGPYRHLGNAWSAGMIRAQNKFIRQNKTIHPFEEYERMPDDSAEDPAITVIHFPLKA